ncbi:cysteine-rich receptor-like protein kinase 10 isoform X1 [Triticum urartu]|uniref:cysteine-rich receptor-like protein kinase 10 isoform X1 n=1 Tax=Triticum urartu TaxID=4572 RepID=UPI0020431008|nr:cysteine-rich receptor-like protein kinase 10 isoform X1 [Triticum urartu]XP_048566228.1 cysteine-rich receptor-like protein kinase 10 isoform X1 [Triticum urartu]XP_048566229.1 cysteine-rich receptor-like protein kinase 10 isoform X1 [Triticum urartu]XP_048566230.1 cysteine-rich receptor-like protein kinase 10 isoform X1 [Triticum urartu]
MRFLSSVDLPCYPWMAMVILPLLLLLMPLTAAQLWPSCGESGDYKSNSTYEANLKLLSTTLPKKAASSTNLFATDTVGNVPNVIFALALCRGDSNASACEGCLVTAFQDAQEHCANYKDATVYYDSNPCMLRFSNQNFLATTVNDHILVIVSIESLMMNIPTRADSFKLLLFTLLNSTAQSAANSSRRFTTSRLDVNSFPTLYCLMQCTPDLTANDCTACLQPYFQYTVKYMDGKKGGRVLGTRCTMRYEIFPFFQGDPMLRIINLVSEVPAINNTTPLITVNPSPQSQSPSPVAAPPPPGAQATTKEIHGRNSRQRPLWIIAVAAPLLSIFLCVICFVVWMRRRRKGMEILHDQAAMNRPEEDALVWRLEGKSSEFTLFDLSEVLRATHNFSKENLLGQGGFGPVYKFCTYFQGQLPDGTEIAVKRLASHSGQGFTEFKNEVELIAKLQHSNLVKLMGCCIKGEEKLLVYEYLPNKSLDFFIFDVSRTTLVDWEKRRVIIEGIAQGLLYLHKHSRLRIIHRDLKASNILLDQDMNPKISDFGLAKIFSSNDTQGSTKKVVGTYGYMAPEYASEGIYSIKSDVFSFGVLLLEILSGKRNSGFHQHEDFLNLLGYSWHLWEGGRCLELLEASIVEEIHAAEASRYINIALMCVQERADDRPTMSTVVAMLNSENVSLPGPKHPAYFNLRVSKEDESGSVPYSNNADTICSNNDLTITEEPDGR